MRPTSEQRTRLCRARRAVLVGLVAVALSAAAVACNAEKPAAETEKKESEGAVSAASAGEAEGSAPEAAPQPEAAAAAAAAEPAPAPVAAAAEIPADAEPTQVDLLRVAHHFVSSGVEGEDLLPFEAALLTDRSVYRVDTRARVLVHKADDGSLIGFVDHNRNSEPDSIYTLAEVAALEPGADPDTVEIVFRIHHAVEDKLLVFSDREHRHVSYALTGTEFAGVPITTWMSSKQYGYYERFWAVPASWQFVDTYVLPPPEVAAAPKPKSKPKTKSAPKPADSGVSFEGGVTGGTPHINIKLKN